MALALMDKQSLGLMTFHLQSEYVGINGAAQSSGEDTPPRALAADVPRVLIVDDDRLIVDALAAVFARFSIPTAAASSMAEARSAIGSFRPTVALVDLQLPDGNGMELVRWIRDATEAGVIVLTGNPDETERVVGLEIGADDYLTKPAPNREVVARVRAVHRRVVNRILPGEPAGQPKRAAHFTVGQVRVDLLKGTLTDERGRSLSLTGAEMAALGLLAEAGGEIVSRSRLCEAALRRPWNPEDRSIDQLVYLLRRKLTAAGADDQAIKSVRGVGYTLTTLAVG
jgi:DNA-binding response OmpR family regulator